MRRIVVSMLTLSLCAGIAQGADIDGKWGISAGLFTFRGEASLIRGLSDRSAWILDFTANADNQTGTLEQALPFDSTTIDENSNRVSFELGPRYRRFMRPSSNLSPYWDAYVHALYYRSHASGTSRRDERSVGATSGIGLGLEYFTPWHFSVAAQTELLDFTWIQLRREYSSDGYGQKEELHGESVRMGFSPALYVRGYW